MKEERNIITIDEYGNISLPTDIGATAMTEWEICELFGVIAPTVRAGITKRENNGVRVCRYRHRAEPPMDGVTVSRSGYQSVIQSYIHTVIPSHGRKGAVSRPQESGAVIPVYKGKASTGLSVGFKVRRLRRQGNNLHPHSSGSILPPNLASDRPMQKSL